MSAAPSLAILEPGAPASFRIRTPREGDMAACRMLLGADLVRGSNPEFLLAIGGVRIAGAAAFLAGADSIDAVRIRVVRPLRRQGIGAMLLTRVEETARERGLTRIHTSFHDDGSADAGATGAFLAARGFALRYTLTTVEASVPAMAEYYAQLCDRLRRSGRVPPEACVVPLSAAPLGDVIRLYESRMAPERLAARRLTFGIDHPRYRDCPVALLSGKVAGMLLWEIHGETGFIPVRAVAPEFEGSWVNPLLLERATAQSFEHEIERIRFEIPEGNRDTSKLAARYGARVVGALRQYVRRLDA
ncbi:MAG: GNAT family N-acetyltransferase [Bryobacteraceae bacterium]